MKRVVLALVIAALLSLAVAKLLLFDTPMVAGNDMAPTLQPGDLLLANRLARQPARGSIVLLRHPQTDRLLLRRVMAVPGDTIGVISETPQINGKAARRKRLAAVTLKGRSSPTTGRAMMLIEEESLAGRYDLLKDRQRRSRDLRPRQLDGTYFVLSDNRNHGSDSRDFGPVPAASIVATVIYRLHAGSGTVEPQQPRANIARLDR